MTQHTEIHWFKIFGKWLVAPSKHTHPCAQWSHASVGLAQACPNYDAIIKSVLI